VADLWYYTIDGHPKDPVSREELRQLANNGSLKPTDLVWTEGMPRWIRAATADGIFAGVPSADVLPDAGAPRPRADVEPADLYDERPSRRRRERERDRWEDDYADALPRKRGMSPGAKVGVILGCVLVILAVGGVVLYLALSGGVSQPIDYSVSLRVQESDSRRIEFKAGTQYRITVTSDRNSDVDILIFDDNSRLVALDESIGPNSLVTFSPRATSAFRVEVRNLGPGNNRSHVRFEETPAGQAPPPAFKRPDMNLPIAPPSIRNVPGKMILNRSDQLTLTDSIDLVRKRNCRCKIFTVAMQAGKRYHIVLEGPTPKGKQVVLDPFLRLEDNGGRALRSNDDGGGDFLLNSYIFFQPAVTGNYRVIATSLVPQTGPFTLRVHEE
jgi:hypothetical protein